MCFWGCCPLPGSKRDVFVADWRRHGGRRLGLGVALIEVVAACRTARIPARLARTLAPATEKHQIVSHDFRHVFLLSALLIFLVAGLKFAINVNLATLFQILAGDLCQPLPQHYVVPFGAVLPLAVFVLETLVRSNRDFRYRCA